MRQVNVIIYVLDSLRADHLSCYGYSRQTSPNIDLVTKESVLFENAFSQSTWTRPSAASILTSTYPSTTGVRTRTDFFPAGITTLPEILREYEFNTLGISTIGNVSSVLGFARGFNKFIDLYKESYLFKNREVTTTAKERLTNEDTDLLVLPLAEDINNALFPWLEKHRNDNNFIFIWAIDTHDPYNPPEDFKKFVDADYQGKMDGSREKAQKARSKEDIQHLINLYDSGILYNDFYIGELVKKLKDLGKYDETMLIITGDHGEAFHDHQKNFGHGYIPYEELIHVPLIIKFPKSNYRNIKISELVQLIDLMPTILETVGISDEAIKQVNLQGKSVLPLLKGKITNEYVYSETNPIKIQDSYFSIRSENWKYILIESPNIGIKERLRQYLKIFSNLSLLRQIVSNLNYYLRKQTRIPSEMLFNLAKDSKEQNDLKKTHPEIVEKYRTRLTKWREENERLAKYKDHISDEFKIDQETERNLRDLGYID